MIISLAVTSALKYLPTLHRQLLSAKPNYTSYTHVRESDYKTFNSVNVYQPMLSKISVPFISVQHSVLSAATICHRVIWEDTWKQSGKFLFKVNSSQLFCLFYKEENRENSIKQAMNVILLTKLRTRRYLLEVYKFMNISSCI